MKTDLPICKRFDEACDGVHLSCSTRSKELSSTAARASISTASGCRWSSARQLDSSVAVICAIRAGYGSLTHRRIKTIALRDHTCSFAVYSTFARAMTGASCWLTGKSPGFE